MLKLHALLIYVYLLQENSCFFWKQDIMIVLHNNGYWCAILTLDKATLQVALPLCCELNRSRVTSIKTGAGAGASVSSARQFRFETRRTHSLAGGLLHRHGHGQKHKRSPQSMEGIRNLRQLVDAQNRAKSANKMCLVVCVCVCVWG